MTLTGARISTPPAAIGIDPSDLRLAARMLPVVAQRESPRRGWRAVLHRRLPSSGRRIVAIPGPRRALALRDLQLRYKQTVFGVGWAVIQPLLAALVFTLVFDRWAGIRRRNPVPVFVLTRLAAWFYFSSSLEAAAPKPGNDEELRHEGLLPAAAGPSPPSFPGLIDLLLSLIVVGGFMIGYGVSPSAGLVTLPLWIGAVVFVAFGPGVCCSAQRPCRDVRYTLVFLFSSGSLRARSYSRRRSSLESWQPVFFRNPMAGVIEGFRWSLLGGPAPPPAALISAGVAVMLAVGGVAYFSASNAGWPIGSDDRASDRTRPSWQAVPPRRGLLPLALLDAPRKPASPPSPSDEAGEPPTSGRYAGST